MREAQTAKIFSRRHFCLMGAAFAVSVAGMALTGCGSRTADGGGAAAPSSSSAAGSGAAAAGAAPASSSGSAASAQGGGGELVLVFSRADENYGVGVVETGNTMVLAQEIASQTGADLFELVPSAAYPAGYDDCCDQAKEEQEEDARPALKELPDLAGYSRVYFGSPVWWGDLPMPVYTAIESLSWEGKEIAPFCTHAGSGGSPVFTAISGACAGATVVDGLEMEGVTAQQDRDLVKTEVAAWLDGLESA